MDRWTSGQVSVFLVVRFRFRFSLSSTPTLPTPHHQRKVRFNQGPIFSPPPYTKTTTVVVIIKRPLFGPLLASSQLASLASAIIQRATTQKFYATKKKSINKAFPQAW